MANLSLMDLLVVVFQGCPIESPCVVGGSLRILSTHMDVDLHPPLDTRTTEKESKWKCSSVSPSLLPLKSVINDWETT